MNTVEHRWRAKVQAKRASNGEFALDQLSAVRNLLLPGSAIAILGVALLTGCNLAPKYQSPPVSSSPAFKELPSEQLHQTDGWKTAEPNDEELKGRWWQMFNDAGLQSLEDRVTVSNQTVAVAYANFVASRAIVKQARSQYYPTITANPSVTRSRQPAFRSTPGGTATGAPVTFTEYSLPIDATWELDLWGRVRNSVRANSLEALAARADLENTLLSVQAEAAADYFQIRVLDEEKRVLDSAVSAYGESLRLTQVRHDTGIASEQDVAQAETLLHTTEAQALDVGIQRAQLEHALALLEGRPASGFSLAPEPLTLKPVAVPFGVPSHLLERRPDVAAAERRTAEANAQIGVARAGYFPALTLTGSAGYQSTTVESLFTGPTFVWSVGAGLAQTLFDAGRSRAVTEQARATYEGAVASYRETVLTAFQEVEDNLSTLRILSQELVSEDAAVESAQRYLALAQHRYQLGIDSYLNVIAAQTTLLGNQRTALNLRMLELTADVQLIKALGGGWDVTQITATTKPAVEGSTLKTSRE